MPNSVKKDQKELAALAKQFVLSEEGKKKLQTAICQAASTKDQLRAGRRVQSTFLRRRIAT